MIKLMRGKPPHHREIERMQEMGKRVRLKWNDRIKQPNRPVRVERYRPFDETIFGSPISREELRQRVEFRKAF